jgi:beta-lactamase regulating signal transducer with metallopeptidase domain
MTAQLPFTADLIQAFGWALLHSFWQAFFIFACLRLVLFLWPQASSSIKYNLSYLSLTGIFCWFLATLWQQIEIVQKVHQAALLMIETGVRRPSFEVPAIYHSQTELTGIFPNLETWFPVLIVIYIAGVGVMTIKLVMDLVQLQQIRKNQVSPIDPAWEKYLQKLATQLSISRKVSLLISQHIQVPVMIGFLKPVILLPVTMFNNLTAEQLEAILLHELAHIKRNDYLLNIFQSIIETILFFNPFIWWISKNIRLEREHCCDDLVIAGKVQPLHYAKALVALEEYRLTVNALAMAAANDKQHLFHRIKRIMEMKTKNINYTQQLLAVSIIAVGLVSIAWLNPSNKEEYHPQKNIIAADMATAPITAATAFPVITNTIKIAHFTLDTVPANNKRQIEKYAAEATQSSMDAAKLGMEAASKAMKEIDWNQINTEVSNAMKGIDWEKINKEVETAVKNIDWDKINQDIKTDLDQAKHQPVDAKLIEESVRMGLESAKTAMAAISSDEFRKHMTDAQAAALNSKELKAAMADVKKEMAKAQAEMQHAQKEVALAQRQATLAARQQRISADNRKVISAEYRSLVDQMAADNLIDIEKGYTIEKKNNTLSINGLEQSADVYKKYADVLNKVTQLTIKGKKDRQSITIDEK